MPRLTYVVPVFRPKPEVFERHVKSLRDQALKDWEAIFVLDGPSSEARKIIAKTFNGGNYNFSIVEIPHSGAQAARNKGGTMASGEFLCFFDSDCVIEPGTSKLWVEQFDKRPEVGFIYSGYKFFGEKYAIESEAWDPWTLKIRNYVSGCFPMRRSLYPGWTEGLKSLQDWDMWLSLVEKAEEQGLDISKLGLYIKGYAFSTAMPDPDSISGKGCTEDVWLERYNAVRTLHNIQKKDVCVASLDYRLDGITLAKLIDADFQTFPVDKPHEYKTIVQIGFSLGSNAEKHAAIFQKKDVKKVLYWTPDNINEIWHSVSLRQIDAMATLLNDVSTQFVEDKEAKRLMERAGFKVQVSPLPLGKPEIKPMPKSKKWLLDISGAYSPMISVIAQSLPDMDLEYGATVSRISDYRGLIHLFPDKSISSQVKRTHLTGRHVISNIQQPFCNYVEDRQPEKFVVEMVKTIRELTNKEPDPEAAEYYSAMPESLLEAIK